MSICWIPARCGNENFSYTTSVEKGSKSDCVPTAVAILVWNMGYGLATDIGIRRAAIYAQCKSEGPRKPSSDNTNRYFLGHANLNKTGYALSEARIMLDSYGLKHECYLRDGTTIIVDLLNNLEDGDSALVSGQTKKHGGGPHTVCVMRRNNIVVALDRIPEGQVYTTLKDGKYTIASKNNDTSLNGTRPGGKNQQQCLYNIHGIIIVKSQKTAGALARAVGYFLSNLGDYKPWPAK